METKAISLEIKADDKGYIEGYGSVFGNVDSYGDKIAPGAFSASLKARKPKMLWQHDMSDPIGVWEEVREDSVGLFMRGRIAIKTQRGGDAYELAMAGALDGLSIGYMTQDYAIEDDVRVLSKVDLWETSLVTFPANEAARLTSVKSHETATVRDVERVFREMGYPASMAKAMASGAWKGREVVLRDAGALGPEIDPREVDELKASITKLLQNIGGTK